MTKANAHLGPYKAFQRAGYLVIVVILVVGTILAGQPKKKVPCKPSLDACPEEGCGKSFDPNLNRRKNIIAADGPATPRTLTWMKKLDDPEDFSKGDERDELKTIGEGKKITVTAYLLIARAEPGGESCNCGLQTPE